MRRIRIFRGQRRKKELQEEIESHLQIAMGDRIARGESQEAARQAALREFGNISLIQDVTRTVWGWLGVERLVQDGRFTLRQVRRSPAFAVMVVGALGLGIGACTLVFAIVYGALINPYPYRDANRIVQMGFHDKRGIRGFMAVTAHDLPAVRHSPLVEDAMLTGFADPITAVDGYPQDVRAALLSADSFRFLGVKPLLGRTFTTQDQNKLVTVLGYEFCRNHYACNRNILGRIIDLNRRGYTIVGVMPQRFTWEDASIFLPLTAGSESYPLYLRPRKGVSPGALADAMLALVRRFVLASDGVALPAEVRLTAEPLGERRGGTMRERLEVLLASVLLLLLIACANASILMSGRAIAREHEFGIRQALGAGRSRLVRQLLTEAMLLALCGGILGAGLAYGGIALLRVPLIQSFLPAEAVLSVNAQVLGFSTLLAAGTGLLFGIVPGLEVSGILFGRRRLGLRATGATRRSRSHRGMVLAQVALTLVLLATAVTTIRAFLQLYRLDLGYDPHHVLTFRLPIPEGEYATWSQRLRYYSALQQQLAAIPGVTSASVDEAMATSGGTQMEYGMPSVAWGPDMDSRMPRADFEFVDTSYLGTMRIPVLAGRPFTQDEYSRGNDVALINRSFARRLFGSTNPVGRLLRLPPLAAGYPGILRPAHPDEYVRIIGVTGDVLAAWSPGTPPRETLYLPASLFLGAWNVRAQLRTSGDPMSLLETARKAIRGLNPGQPISQARTIDGILSEDLRSRDRWLAALFGAFAGLALALAVAGLYSVVSYAVTQRKREIGIRMALGARREDIFRATLLSEISIVFAGILAGFALSVPAQSLLTRLFALHTGGGWILPISGAAMMAVAIFAASLPSYRASRVDPMEVLRTE